MTRRSVAVFAVASFVVGLGLMAMTVAGAPRTLVLLQGSVGLASLAAAALAYRFPPTPEGGARLICALALVVMAAPLLFPGIDGVRRWIDLGPIQIQPAAIALPLVTWFVARSADNRLAALALLTAGVIGAVQPDLQTTTGVTAVAICMALLLRGGALWWGVLGAIILSGVAAAFGSGLDPVPYVEQILPLSFQTHWGLGLAVAAGLAAVPLLMLAAFPERGRVALALAALWVGLVSACLAAQFPTPILGYGLSWILGFALSLGLTAPTPQAQPGLFEK